MILIASATSFAHAREYMLAPWAVANIGNRRTGLPSVCCRHPQSTRLEQCQSWTTCPFTDHELGNAIPLACIGHSDGKRTSQSSAPKKFAEACRLRFLDRNGSRSYGASGRVMNGAHRSLTSGVRPPAATQSRRNSKDFLGFRSCVLRST